MLTGGMKLGQATVGKQWEVEGGMYNIFCDLPIVFISEWNN